MCYSSCLVFVDCCYNFIDLFVSYFSREMQQDKPGSITTLENINMRGRRGERRETLKGKNRNLPNERILITVIVRTFLKKIRRAVGPCKERVFCIIFVFVCILPGAVGSY